MAGGHWCHYYCFLSECQEPGPGHIKASVLGPGPGVQCSHSVDDKTKHKEACPESIAPQDGLQPVEASLLMSGKYS